MNAADPRGMGVSAGRLALASAWKAACLVAVATLAGCSLLQPATKPEPVAAEPPPPPPLPVPSATHRFVVEPGQDVIGAIQVVTITDKEDTLPDIARRFNVGYEEIVRANPGVDPWLPGVGREIVVPTQFVLPDAPRQGVVINVAAMRLFYYPKPEAPPKGAKPAAAGKQAKLAKGEKPKPAPPQPQVVITHPIGIGKVGWQTPEGVTKITSRVKDPVWTPPLSVRLEHRKNGEELPPRVPAGPDNPLGAHMFRLGWPSYLVHGTNKPYGVGMRSSHGCVRLYPEDIAQLYETVPVGTQVRVVNQPYLLGWQREGGHERLYVQAYGPLEDDKRDWKHGPKSLLKKAGKTPLWQKVRAHDAEIDWDAARAQSEKPRGIPVPVMKSHPVALDAIVAAAPRVQNVLPTGATWDGRTELLVDEATFDAILNDRDPEPDASTTGTGAAPKPARTSAAPAATTSAVAKPASPEPLAPGGAVAPVAKATP